VNEAERSGRVGPLRLVVFGIVCALCLAGAVVVIVRGDPTTTTTVTGEGTGGGTTVPVGALAAGPHAVFVDTRLGDGYGRVALSDLRAGPDGPVALTDLRCERVDMAGDRGICLSAERGAVTRYHLSVFDRNFNVLSTRDLPGLPSRTRVSPDGSRGAMTTFVGGDSYLNPGQFATRTELLDLHGGSSFGDLESFRVMRDGQPYDRVDFNFWGVTFSPTDPNRFYATLGTEGKQFLGEGDLAGHTVTVLRDGVECPSLSPDGSRIAFKKRVAAGAGRIEWRLSVLDLATLADHPLAETRSVDDQAAWLDDGTVLYGRPQSDSGTPTKDTFAVPADGSGTPRVLRTGAFSLAPELARG
jgi:hypothetical protein